MELIDHFHLVSKVFGRDLGNKQTQNFIMKSFIDFM